MLKNYFKTTFRSLWKNKVFTLINVFGLSIGLMAAIFIFQYTYFQLSFDDFHQKSENIYRVINERFEGDKLIQKGQITYSAVGPQLTQDFPEVLNHTTINVFGGVTLSYDEEVFNLQTVPLVEPSYFEFFDYPISFGSLEGTFESPFEIILTEGFAMSLFGISSREDLQSVIGETIFFGADRNPFVLKAIIRDLPENTSLDFEALISRETVMSWWGESARFSWTGSDYYHYLELAEEADLASVEAKLEEFSDKYFRGDEVTGTFEKFLLQPLDEVHLNPEYEYENHNTADGRMVWILILIGVFILVMAWVNYINLTTSRALHRAKEVGLRKVIGASRSQLIAQFLMESLFLNLAALFFSITLVQLLQAKFESLIDQKLDLIAFATTTTGFLPMWALWLVLVALGALFSGLYPAFVLSRHKPVETLKGNFSNSTEGVWLRKSLVVFQFVLSTALIAGTYLVVKQTNFMRQQDLGANVEQVLTVNGPSITALDTTFITTIGAFLNTLEQNSNVIKAGSSTNDFGERLPRTFNVTQVGDTDGHMLNRIGMNYGFLDVYEIDFAAGRNFRPTDHNKEYMLIESCILNATAAKLFGFDNPEDAISKKLSFFGKDWTIIGVTDDFHQRSLKEPIEPLIMLPLYDGGSDTYHIRLNTSNVDETIKYISSVYDDFYPGDLFTYGFTDQQFDQFYASDRQFGKVFNLFSLIAISIACLGLFGLVGYTAAQKTKEIGIRKVLGASVPDILKMISKEFLSLIVLAGMISVPLTYIAGKQWLKGYAYQTDIPTAFFIVPIGCMLIIAASIVIGQTLKTAKENPINALHQE